MCLKCACDLMKPGGLIHLKIILAEKGEDDGGDVIGE